MKEQTVKWFQKEGKKGLLDNSFQLTAKFYVAFIGFLATITTVRFLTETQFAVYTTFFSIPVVFGLIQTGLGISAIRTLKKDQNCYTSILVYSSLLSAILIILNLLFSPVWTNYFSGMNWFYTIPLSLIIFGNFTITDNILHAQKKFKELAIINSIIKTFSVVGVIVLALIDQLFALIIIESSFVVLKTLSIWYYERDLIDWSKTQFSDFKQVLRRTPKSSIWFFSQFYLQANVFISSLLLTSSAVSTLGALNIFGQPYMITATALASTSIVQTKKNRYMSFILGFLLLLGGTIVINVAPQFWTQILTGGKYSLIGYILPYTVGLIGIGLLHIFTAIRLNQDLLPWETIVIATIHVALLIGLLTTGTGSLTHVVYVTLFTGGLGFLVTVKYGVNYLRHNFKMI